MVRLQQPKCLMYSELDAEEEQLRGTDQKKKKKQQEEKEQDEETLQQDYETYNLQTTQQYQEMK